MRTCFLLTSYPLPSWQFSTDRSALLSSDAYSLPTHILYAFYLLPTHFLLTAYSLQVQLQCAIIELADAEMSSAPVVERRLDVAEKKLQVRGT